MKHELQKPTGLWIQIQDKTCALHQHFQISIKGIYLRYFREAHNQDLFYSPSVCHDKHLEPYLCWGQLYTCTYAHIKSLCYICTCCEICEQTCLCVFDQSPTRMSLIPFPAATKGTSFSSRSDIIFTFIWTKLEEILGDTQMDDNLKQL